MILTNCSVFQHVLFDRSHIYNNDVLSQYEWNTYFFFIGICVMLVFVHFTSNIFRDYTYIFALASMCFVYLVTPLINLHGCPGNTFNIQDNTSNSIRVSIETSIQIKPHVYNLVLRLRTWFKGLLWYLASFISWSVSTYWALYYSAMF